MPLQKGNGHEKLGHVRQSVKPLWTFARQNPSGIGPIIVLLRLFLLFTLIPFVELVLLVWLTRATNFWVTLAIVVTTGLIGATLARQQGLMAWQRVRLEMSQGRPPGASLVDAVMILIAGILLITPGILTDVCGILLLIPGMRRGLRQVIVAWLARRATVRFESVLNQARRSSPKPTGPEVIDAEFTREPVDPDETTR